MVFIVQQLWSYVIISNFKTLFSHQVKSFKSLDKKFLPFSDVASENLPLWRLCQLSLFQISVGVSVVLMVGTLNRVMIVELGVASTVVALMVALPLLFAPFRAFVGFKSDTHKSFIGWKRVPYIWLGSLFQFGGLAIMPFSLILLSGDSHWPYWVALLGAGLAFMALGVGVQTVQTAGLALATDIAPEKARPRVVALMYTMLLVGMVVSSIFISFLLEPFTQIRLIQVIQSVAVICFLLNIVALWKQEVRRPQLTSPSIPRPMFSDVWRKFILLRSTRRFLLALGFGTVAFSMQDIILEPYGGEILNLSVSKTTLLTALSSLGAVLSFLVIAKLLKMNINVYRIAAMGAIVGIFGFSFIVFAEPLSLVSFFFIGVILIGFGGGLFSVSCLISAMQLEANGFTGLALGAWGAVQATSMGLGVAVGGILRDFTEGLLSTGYFGYALNPVSGGYLAVYHFEILLLFVVLVVIGPLVNRSKSVSKNEGTLGLAQFPG